PGRSASTALRGGAQPCGSCRSPPDLQLAVVSRATGAQDPVAAMAGQAHLGPVAQADDDLLAELDDLPDRLALDGAQAGEVEPVPGLQLPGARGHPQAPPVRGAPLLPPPQAIHQTRVVGVAVSRDRPIHRRQAPQTLAAMDDGLFQQVVDSASESLLGDQQLYHGVCQSVVVIAAVVLFQETCGARELVE